MRAVEIHSLDPEALDNVRELADAYAPLIAKADNTNSRLGLAYELAVHARRELELVDSYEARVFRDVLETLELALKGEQ